jgi:hypothetical protein
MLPPHKIRLHHARFWMLKPAAYRPPAAIRAPAALQGNANQDAVVFCRTGSAKLFDELFEENEDGSLV